MTSLTIPKNIEERHPQSSGLPLLRWAGGKQRFAKRIANFIKENLDNRLYVEPFFGAGSVFMELQPERALLGDINPCIIQLCNTVINDPIGLSRELIKNMQADCEEHYYNCRDNFNQLPWSTTQAARFLYLNRTCFNGIYRVNQRGEFNVPYGHKPRPVFPSQHDILTAADLLRKSVLHQACFRETLDAIQGDSFIFLDPPYPPINETAYFEHYTSTRFDEEEHEDLADCMAALSARGVKFVMTNADVELNHCLYRDFNIAPLAVTRNVSCLSNKMKATELLIWNF